MVALGTVLLGMLLLAAGEVAALVAVAERIGVFDAVGLLVVVSLCGPWVVRRAGFSVLRRARDRLLRGGTPEREVLDGVVLLGAGLLICVPGFVTDAIGVLLLLPPVRALVRVLVRVMVRRRIARRAASSLVGRFGGRWRTGSGLGGSGLGGSGLGGSGLGGSGLGGSGLGGSGLGGSGAVVDAGSHQAAPGGPHDHSLPER